MRRFLSISKVLVYLCSIAICAPMSGCIWILHAKHPAGWEKLQQSGIEQTVTGSYACQGEMDPAAGQAPGFHPFLSNYLLPELRTFNECDRVQFQMMPPNALEVKVFFNNKPVAVRSFSSGKDYFETSNEIKLKTKLSYAGDLFIAARFQGCHLYLDGNENLVLRSDDGGVGLALFMPFVASEYQWATFRRLSN